MPSLRHCNKFLPMTFILRITILTFVSSRTSCSSADSAPVNAAPVNGKHHRSHDWFSAVTINSTSTSTDVFSRLSKSGIDISSSTSITTLCCDSSMLMITAILSKKGHSLKVLWQTWQTQSSIISVSATLRLVMPSHIWFIPCTDQCISNLQTWWSIYSICTVQAQLLEEGKLSEILAPSAFMMHFFPTASHIYPVSRSLLPSTAFHLLSLCTFVLIQTDREADTAVLYLGHWDRQDYQ